MYTYIYVLHNYQEYSYFSYLNNGFKMVIIPWCPVLVNALKDRTTLAYILLVNKFEYERCNFSRHLIGYRWLLKDI